ncbi:Proteasome subunit beta type-7 [Babesia sp. Xinjiang]|uniref:Proteasome subunit beta type-7 n=1 Tax=Babesia sp. Xinjiang TaxID=462227 RepID=UPI000A219035|nr:Proteasome subunit beta type-7 [Babesia sp. Xinjiang]ORM41979.1 Proteasome subunit beta type-7 [Babesia sp. Xinjiang]
MILMDFGYVREYISQHGGWDMSNFSRNSRIKDDVKGFKVLKTGTTICGVLVKEGVVLAADTRATEGPIVADKNCSKLHRISDFIYCAGAGVAADLEHTTLWLENNIELLRLNLKQLPKVQMCVSMLVHELFKYQGHKQCALILGGFDTLGPHLFSISPRGSSDSLPFCTMGSGSLNAMSVLETGYRDGMTIAEAVDLATKAISAGILNDLGSGGNVDICVIDRDGAKHTRAHAVVGTRTYAPVPRFVRSDGRSFSDHMPLTVQLNPLKSGPSCRITLGGSSPAADDSGDRTSVMAVVFFSPDNKNRNTVGSYHKPTFEVYVRPPSNPVKGYTRSLECSLLKCLQNLVDGTTLGRLLVSVRLQVLEEGRGLLSVCLNALITCVAVAGLPFREIPHAVQFGILRNNGAPGFIVDPTLEEMREHCATGITMLCEPRSGHISFLSIDYGHGGYETSLQSRMEEEARRIAKARLHDLNNTYQQAFEAARISFEANAW